MSNENNEMNFKIAKLMDERGLKPYPFAMKNEIPSSTMTSIYKGKVKFENISISTFLKIARGLGMTAEELYYGTPEQSVESHHEQPSLTTDEQIVVDGYRVADMKQRRRMLSTACLEIEMADEEAKEKKAAD